MIKSDLEYLLDVVPGYTCDMCPLDLRGYIKEAMILKSRDEDKAKLIEDDIENEVFNEN